MLTRIRDRNEKAKNRVCVDKTRQELSSWDLVARGSDGKYMSTKGSLGFFKEGRQQQASHPMAGDHSPTGWETKRRLSLARLGRALRVASDPERRRARPWAVPAAPVGGK